MTSSQEHYTRGKIAKGVENPVSGAPHIFQSYGVKPPLRAEIIRLFNSKMQEQPA